LALSGPRSFGVLRSGSRLLRSLVDHSPRGGAQAGARAGAAESVARALWLIIFGKAANAKTIRRKIDRVQRCGGAELAPIEAYADQKSVPHLKAPKKQP